MLEIVMAITDEMMRDFPIDPDRVYVSGLSSGGSASWELAIRHHKRVAAVAPMASGEMPLDKAPHLSDVAVRAFHSKYEISPSPEPVRRFVEAINAAGGNAKLIEIESNQHDCWTAAFDQHRLLEWMLLQTRGMPPIDLQSETWLEACQEFIARFGFVVLIPVLLIAAWRIEKQRRFNMMETVLQSKMQSKDGVPHDGFTLVEVIVVIAIIGVLVAITLPAIQMARESSRRSSCANNLRQQAVAVKLHEQTHQIFPTGGWKEYLGDPDAGYGPKQPGGWIYNILSYIEEDSLRQLGRGLKGQPREEALKKLMESPLEVFYCPSRRLARLYPYTGPELKNAKPPEKVAKTDYAISAEISYEKSEVIVPDIQLHGKGMSKTVLAGEKSLSEDAYDTGTGAGDMLVAYVGDSDDIRRQASGAPTSDKNGGAGFGGPHPGGANFAYCDGSVRFVSDDEELDATTQP